MKHMLTVRHRLYDTFHYQFYFKKTIARSGMQTDQDSVSVGTRLELKQTEKSRVSVAKLYLHVCYHVASGSSRSLLIVKR